GHARQLVTSTEGSLAGASQARRLAAWRLLQYTLSWQPTKPPLTKSQFCFRPQFIYRSNTMNDSRFSISRREMYALLAASPAALGMLATSARAQDANQPKRAGRVLMPIGDATESLDSMYPIFRLAEEGYEVVVSGPEAR